MSSILHPAAEYPPGRLVKLRGREWVVLPSEDKDLLRIKPLGGSEEEVTAVYLPLAKGTEDEPCDAKFEPPGAGDIRSFSGARLLLDSARLAFRNGAGPFRSLAKLSFRPRSYQIVPLVMALRQEAAGHAQDKGVRLLIADDVGVGKTVEALLVVREMLERGVIRRFAIVCLPHLCEQWQSEIREKLDIEAVIIRSSTQARLDRAIRGDTGVFDYYPFQIISIDYIKSDSRRDTFIRFAPELVVVDEAHTCGRPEGQSAGQQQRHDLVAKLAKDNARHLLLLTATPHSGKTSEFNSLLGFLDPAYDRDTFDLAKAGEEVRRRIATQFVQRRRADVEKWMTETTPFAERVTDEVAYSLSGHYRTLFEQLLDFSRELVANTDGRKARIRYWTALALLRGVISSPDAGVEMLRNRIDNLRGALAEDSPFDAEDTENPVMDSDYGFEGDATPTDLVDCQKWSESESRRLRKFAEELAKLTGPKHDAKLAAAIAGLREWIREGHHPVVFCRYIATAKYLADQLGKAFPDCEVIAVTSEDPDDVRRDRIDALADKPKRLLVATDCLSEGINLQGAFSAVMHYDLPWNPNRLEQREGRVDRFGQTRPRVLARLLYGRDNSMDAIVLDVLLRKVRQIRKTIGISIPFPEDSQSVLDAVAKAVLRSPSKTASQLELDLDAFEEGREAKLRVEHRFADAAEREKAIRNIFAQNAIKPHEVESDLRAVDEAIGAPSDVESFVVTALKDLFGATVDGESGGVRKLYRSRIPDQLLSYLPSPKTKGEDFLRIAFQSPTPPEAYYLGRNHRFVEQLCRLVMADALVVSANTAGVSQSSIRPSRAAVIRTDAVEVRTTLLLFRCRNVIEEKATARRVVAEEMILWGWRGSLSDALNSRDTALLSPQEARELFDRAKPVADLTPQARADHFEAAVTEFIKHPGIFDEVAHSRSESLRTSHESFGRLMVKSGASSERFQVVVPVLPMDTLGLYVLLPAPRA